MRSLLPLCPHFCKHLLWVHLYMDCVGCEAKGQTSPIRSVGLRLEVRDRELLSCCKACLEWTHSQVASKISETRKSKDPDVPRGMGRLFTNTKANTVSL